MIAKMLGAALAFSFLSSAQITPKELIGRWKVTAAVAIGEVLAKTDYHLIGKLVTIRPGSFQFDGDTCDATFEVGTQPLKEFYKENKLHPDELKLTQDPVTLIQAGCAAIFSREPGKILFNWEGTVFEAERYQPKAAPVQKQK